MKLSCAIRSLNLAACVSFFIVNDKVGILSMSSRISVRIKSVITMIKQLEPVAKVEPITKLFKFNDDSVR